MATTRKLLIIVIYAIILGTIMAAFSVLIGVQPWQVGATIAAYLLLSKFIFKQLVLSFAPDLLPKK